MDTLTAGSMRIVLNTRQSKSHYKRDPSKKPFVRGSGWQTSDFGLTNMTYAQPPPLSIKAAIGSHYVQTDSHSLPRARKHRRGLTPPENGLFAAGRVCHFAQYAALVACTVQDNSWRGRALG